MQIFRNNINSQFLKAHTGEMFERKPRMWVKQFSLRLEKLKKRILKALYGIFGDVIWTNKDRLSDELLIDLIEHFSSKSST